jgi:S1-C subfamily serine protease
VSRPAASEPRRPRRGPSATAARRAAALLAATLALLLAGCGGGDDGGEGGGGQQSPAGTAQEAPPQVIVQAAENGFNAVGVYREASPGVVTIRSVFEEGSSLLGAGPTAAEGSGFVLNDDGEIVTNAHVVTTGSGDIRSEADGVFVEFPDGNILPAEVLGFDPFYDVALLRVDPEKIDLDPLELGDDSDLIVGQPVAAIGSPFGEQQSLSIGVVSAIGRSVRSLTQFEIDGAIQTDASINPGNSGGPLLDAQGRVIGINQQIETQSGANDGVGFAVPISAITRSIDQLREKGEVTYAYIGVSSQPLYPQLADRLDLDAEFGALISDVQDGSPADEAGLRGGDPEDMIRFQAARYRTGGDVILSLEGKPITRPDDLARLISAADAGDVVSVGILRDGERRNIEVELGVRPASLQAG